MTGLNMLNILCKIYCVTDRDMSCPKPIYSPCDVPAADLPLVFGSEVPP
jgi:hypothetical protein